MTGFVCGRDGRRPYLDPVAVHTVEMFAAYLHDAAVAGVNPNDPMPDSFEAREFLARWRPYMLGQYPGPVEAYP